MIIYENNKHDFINDVFKNLIADKIKENMKKLGIFGGNESEYRSWVNSMQYMKNVIETNNIDNDAYIAIEYKIPSSRKRIDFMIAGLDENNNKNLIIIELKQWEKAEPSTKEDIVKTYVGKKEREVQHPSYQARSYKYLLELYKSVIDDNNIICNSFSYLHNASEKENSFLKDNILFSYINDFPIFFKQDVEKLQDKIVRLIGKGKGKSILYEVERNKLRPSKKLINLVGDVLRNNEQFILIESQKDVFENIASRANEVDNIFIINGNPGTGKSVVAINLLKKFIEKKQMVKFVAPNSSFQNEIKYQLKKHAKMNKYKDGLDSLFSGAMNFINMEKNDLDWVIVDEAHRLKNKQNLYKGENQIEDIIKSAKNVVFFVDENQVIRTNDIGTNNNIIVAAKKFNKNILFGEELQLKTQFRCVGTEGYINALDTTLQIEETGNFYLNEDEGYEIKICDSPQEMETLLNSKINQGFNNSKILAGYAWEWKSQKVENDLQLEQIHNHDIVIEEYDNWSIPWNFSYANNLWVSQSIGKRQAGSIHTVQGLEFDYCGVIIGNDLSIDENNNIFAIYDNYKDKAGKTNYRGGDSKNLKEDNKELSRLIKNIYKVLLTRGQKGTFIFIRDEKLRDYFKKHIKNNVLIY